MKKGLSLTLEEKVIELVERKAEELGMSRSVFIEYVLRQYFGLYPKFGGDSNGKN
jgi:metal-responsive CopG/Arc/MetJ family transcriptional regulator